MQGDRVRAAGPRRRRRRAKPPLLRPSTLTAAGVIVVAAAGGLAAWTDHGGRVALPGPSRSAAPPAASATPAPSSPAQSLAALARRGSTADWTATYDLQPVDPAQPKAAVTIFRLGRSFRIDIAEPKSTTLFLTTAQGYVSCRVQGNQRSCFLVGRADKPVPKVFDPGLQRIITTNLPAMAGDEADLDVSPAGELAQVPGRPPATCFQVSGGDVDTGEYCLTADGVPRRITYPTGTLTLTKLEPAPNPQVFMPPVDPTPLPSSPGSATPPAS